MIPWWGYAISIVLLLLIVACVLVALKILWRQLTDYNKPVNIRLSLDHATLHALRTKTN